MNAIYKFLIRVLAAGLLVSISPGTAAELPEKDLIVFGIAEINTRSATKEELEVAFTQMFKETASQVGASLKIVAYQDNEQLIQALRNHQIDGFFGSSIDFFKNRALINPDYLFSVAVQNKLMQHFLLIVRKDSNIQQIEQLRNKKLAYTASDEIGIFSLNTLLEKKKQGKIATYFTEVKPKKFGMLTTSAVFFKETDAALVAESDFDTAAELNPQLKQQLVSIYTTPPYITNLLLFRSGLTARRNEQLSMILKTTNQNINSQKLLKMFKASGVEQIERTKLTSVFELIEQSGKSGKP